MPRPKHLMPRQAAHRAAPVRWSVDPSWRATVVIAVVTGLAVVALGQISVASRPSGSMLALWWPAAGVATAGVLLVSARRRWLVLLAVGAATALTTVGSGRPPLFDLALVLGNVVTPAVFAGIVDSRPHGRSLRTLRDLTRFCLAALVATLSSGVLVALLGLAALGADAWLMGLGLTAAHAAALLVMVPFVFDLPVDTRPRRLRAKDRWLVTTLVAATVGLVAVVYGPGQGLPLVLIVLPVLMLGAVLLPPRWVCLELLLAGALTSVLTAAGFGPVALSALGDGASPEVVVLIGQVTLVCYAVAVLPTMVAIHQLRAAAGQAAMTAREYRSVVQDATGTAIIGFDLAGRIDMFSAGAEALLGYTEQEAIGGTGAELWHDPVEMSARARDLGSPPGFPTVVAAGAALSRTGRLDWKAWSREGVPLVISQRLTPRFDGLDATEQTGWIAVAEDVTHRRGMETALREALDREREARERAEQLEALRAALVANVSHELRTPLTSMIGYTALALADLDAPELRIERHRDLLEAAQRNSHRLLHLVEDLLVQSRVESRTLEPECVELGLASLVEGAVETLGTRGSRHGVTVEVRGPDRAVSLWGEQEQVERVITHLLTNAVKFSPPGSTVSLEYGVRGAEVYLRVTDAGPGVPEEERERIFEAFYQGESARAKELPGSGMGLSIARTIAEAHGGSMTLVASELGEGATFEMRLPRVGVIPRPSDGHAASRTRETPTESVAWSSL